MERRWACCSESDHWLADQEGQEKLAKKHSRKVRNWLQSIAGVFFFENNWPINVLDPWSWNQKQIMALAGQGLSWPDMIFVKSFTPANFTKLEIYLKKRVIRHIFDPEYWIFSNSIHRIGMISQSQSLLYILTLYFILGLITKKSKKCSLKSGFLPEWK